MIIKSITLSDFRQFKEKNVIEFSTDSEKNVTIVLGRNTSGKTTLVQAFNWCLYENTNFKTKELLNSQVAAEIPYGGAVEVYVQIVLLHDGQEFTITRTQKYVKYDMDRIRAEKAHLSVSYKSDTGNSIPITPIECVNTINKILPEALSNYFFFDGESVVEINKKREVVSAVRGLMGLDILGDAVDHLDPSKSSSVIGKLQRELNIGTDTQGLTYRRQLEEKEKELENYQNRLVQVESEIEACENEKRRLSDKLKDTAEVRGKQAQKENLERDSASVDSMLIDYQNRITSDFAKGHLAFFAGPVIKRAKAVLASVTNQGEGIPEMHAKSIDYILNRGVCICGCDLTKNQGAVEHIQHERSLLPPQHIGTLVRTYGETCDLTLKRSLDVVSDIENDYAQIRRLIRQKDEIAEELRQISEEIRTAGSVNAAALERDYQMNENALKTKLQTKGRLESDIRFTKAMIDDLKKKLSGLVVQCEKNALIKKEIAYATAVYEWFKESYDRQEKEVKDNLLESVNRIFEKMYHGRRQVTIDDKYRIQLITSVGDAQITTDESKGLEAVKNFSFVSGLVDLARRKARTKDSENPEEGDFVSAEPYPIVMDAPFSHVDETHIKNISTILPEIAEQVILIVMEKDWAYAKETLDNKVGIRYEIEKVDNSDTYSVVRRV